MELKVWVEGIQRIVCGVTETTTCQDVVFALAHATGKIGRFTLIERWKTNERLLAPNENPLKILMKWGEYSNDVQFILQRSDQTNQNVATTKNDSQQSKSVQSVQQQQQQQQPIPQHPQSQQQIHRQQQQHIDPNKQQFPSSYLQTTDKSNISPTPLNKDGNRFGLAPDNKSFENIGIVRGIQQVPAIASVQQMNTNSPQHSPNNSISTDPGGSIGANASKPIEFNSADVRNSLDRKTGLFREARHVSNESLMDTLNVRGNDLYNNGPPISSNGALVPPPYRDPPPPRTSPLHQKSDSLSKTRKNDFKDELNNYLNGKDFNDMDDANYQCQDLIQLIKMQREKISIQQADLNKYDAEIVYLENKERDTLQQLDALSREIGKTDQIFRQGNEQLQTLQYVEEENELVRQQEKTLKSEITLLRSKLANCETELLQCKNKIRLIMDDIQIEQRTLNRQFDNRQQLEKYFMGEVERLQTEIDQVVQKSETTTKTTESLKKEVNSIEVAITEKKKQLEQLVNEMKEVNLQSLAVAPSDEIRYLLEGSNRPGSTRRIIGSPRQLENAVPTSKNPHGVWV